MVGYIEAVVKLLAKEVGRRLGWGQSGRLRQRILVSRDTLGVEIEIDKQASRDTVHAFFSIWV